MNEPLAGRVAIVTGAGRGLGRAMALGLARAGARVVATAARERSEIEAVAREDPKIVAIVADVSRDDDCASVVAEAKGRFGRLDVLVNNANVNGPFLMARAAAPVMRAAGWGRIINVSVSQQTMRRHGFSPYGPSKAALESETVIWAQDLAGSGVTVNALLPGGATLTGMIPPRVSSAVRAHLLDPDIVIPPLLWLASTEADGVTGRRLVANQWRPDLDETAMEEAGWGPP